MWPKKKAKTAAIDSQHRYEIRRQAGRLITIANRAETASRESDQPDFTHAGEVIMARDLVMIQTDLRSAIEAALAGDSTVEHLYREIIEPLIEASIVGDLAWMTINTVLDSCKSRQPDQAGFIVDKSTAA